MKRRKLIDASDCLVLLNSTEKRGKEPCVETGWSSTRTEGQPLFSFMAEVPVDVAGSKSRPKLPPPRLHAWRFHARPALVRTFAGVSTRFDAFTIDCAQRSEIANAGGHNVRA